ncbi:hypothetical protein VO56_02995 [Mycoplasmopsis gallinacea]|uniref:Uncharacterized protein n=1 Tax=Mycoplasmopsis gallinacea TaxID=29556 RepID=A0A0D5ZK63_9BACT|nr:hypothetical protein VO56_02995 [Mycoplasmopsis gallinacea]
MDIEKTKKLLKFLLFSLLLISLALIGVSIWGFVSWVLEAALIPIIIILALVISFQNIYYKAQLQGIKLFEKDQSNAN